MKIVYIAHPIGGNVEYNLKEIAKIAREIMLTRDDVVPFAPYYLDCHALNDSIPEERIRGIRNDAEFFQRQCFDELWVYGDHISAGMRVEIDLACKLGIPVRIKDERLQPEVTVSSNCEPLK